MIYVYDQNDRIIAKVKHEESLRAWFKRQRAIFGSHGYKPQDVTIKRSTGELCKYVG